MTVTPDAIVDDILERAGGARRFVIAVAGPPGAGKSTLADALHATLRARGQSAEILPMDGFHMDNALLKARDLLPRKGAPETFDARGFADVLEAIRRGDEEVLVPVFDRSRELAIAAARAIPAETRFVIAEGNYLLLDEAPWTRLAGRFDFTVFVGPAWEVLEERLRERWVFYGLDEEQIRWKLHGNDLPNGRRIVENSRAADLRIDTF